MTIHDICNQKTLSSENEVAKHLQAGSRMRLCSVRLPLLGVDNNEKLEGALQPFYVRPATR